MTTAERRTQPGAPAAPDLAAGAAGAAGPEALDVAAGPGALDVAAEPDGAAVGSDALDVVAESEGAPGGPTRRRASMLRSSSVMAAGTLASRFTGFLRTFVLLYALGVGAGQADPLAVSVDDEPAAGR